MTPEEAVQAIVNQSKTMSRPVYRGQASADWQLQSGAVRRLQDAPGEDLPEDQNELRNLVARYHMEQLIMPMEVIDGATLSNLQRLSVLQHQGAATGLLDFTEYPLIALWFACEELPDKDGKVFVLDIGDPQIATNGRRMDDPFSGGQAVVYYEPDRSLGARIIAQQSVFVIGDPRIPDQYLKSIVVPQQSKAQLRPYLKRLGLSTTALFGDVPGLAAANTTRTQLQPTVPLSPEQYRDRGNRAYQAGRFEDALAAYESYAAARPEVAQPNCLKGDALTVLSSSAGEWQTWAMKSDTPSYHWISIPARDHQPRRMAVPSILCELSRCRRSPGPTRHHGVLRSDPALVHPVRLGIRSQAQASTGPAGRHMAPGRGLRHHPGTAALSLACRRSRWRRHRHPRPVASRPPGCQTLYPQAVEGSGE